MFALKKGFFNFYIKIVEAIMSYKKNIFCTSIVNLIGLLFVSAPLQASEAAKTDNVEIPGVILQEEPNVVLKEKNGDHNLVVTPLLDDKNPVINPIGRSNDASIFESMNAVLAYSPSLRSIQENRVAQQYEVEKAKSGYYPSLDISAAAGVANTSTLTQRNAGTKDYDMAATGQAQATLTQILWNGRAVKNSVDYNIFVLESLDSRVYDNATYLALEGLIAHVDYLRTLHVLELSEAYVATHREILAQQEQLSLSGIMTEADLTQAQARLVRAVADMQDAENAYKNAINNYEQLTGVDMPTRLLPPEMPSQELISPEKIIEKALVKNPKIKTYQSDYMASTEQVELAEADYHPEVTLTFGAKYDNPDLEQKGQESNYTSSQSASLGMNWNLFNGFATRNNVLAATARTRMAREDTITMIDTVKKDIITTFNDWNNAKDLSKTYEEALVYNLATRDNYLSQFTFGTRSLLDVLDAESELYTTQVQLATSQANSTINAWKLLALQGTLLDELGITDKSYQYPLPPLSFDFDNKKK